MAFILLGIHMCNTSLESLCIQLAKNGLISKFCHSNSNKFKGEYTSTAKISICINKQMYKTNFLANSLIFCLSLGRWIKRDSLC